MRSILLTLLIFTLDTALVAQTDSTRTNKTTFSFGGYVKGDYLHTWYQNGDIGENSIMNDFHLPSQIPVGPTQINYHQDAHVKESRISFDVNTEVLGKNIHGYLEMDFLLSVQGNERISNSFTPRMRHFYFEWGDFLFGQTWSTFMVVVIPDDLDFTGAAEGVVFNRQPLIRYTLGNWQFALENPESTVMDYQNPEVSISEKEENPDFVIKRTFTTQSGFWAISTMARKLNNVASTREQKKEYAFGISTGGKFAVGKRGDDFRFMTAYGTGLGRYVGLGFTAGGVLDQNEDIHGIPTLNGYVAYNHYWVPERWSSSFNVSAFEAFNDMSLVSELANDKAYSISLNLKYTPAPELLFGIEMMHGYRELANNIDFGRFSRVQFSAKYSFGYRNSIANEKR